MVGIAFDDPDTWRPLVEAALVHPDSYAGRLTDAGIVQAERVYDQYNRETRWYAWEEIDLASLESGSATGAVAPRSSVSDIHPNTIEPS